MITPTSVQVTRTVPRGYAASLAPRETPFREALLRSLRRLRAPLLWLLLAASLLALAAAAWHWLTLRQENSDTAALVAGRNVEIDPATASSRLLAARGYFLMQRDRMQDAQAILDQASWRAGPEDRADLLFNMANTRLRQAYEKIGAGNYEEAISLVNLAKDEYRRALHLKPDAWGAKFNLDLAMRLVRDLPQVEAPEEEEGEKPESRLWMDLPGVPQGAP